MIKYHGLSYKKMDLHVHTPASHDFTAKDVTPEQIVDQALSMDISAIAITDHNTGDFIDKIKSIAKEKGLVIFPGVEISCSGGEKGIHIIALFSCDKTTDHINSLLTLLGILGDNRGRKEAVTGKSVDDVITQIGLLDGIAVLAHCTSSKGVLNEIKGEHRTIIFKNRALFAVETSLNDFTDEDKKARKTRAIDLLNGKDNNYSNRKLGVYIASDSMKPEDDKHTLQGIGSKYSYFKTDDNITIESLRQCFIDPDVRIAQSFDFLNNKYPYIKSISIDSGFFKGEEAVFHKGLNSIIGAKGAGKSLLVELLRFGLYAPPTQIDILKDHNSKIDKRLKDFGSVNIIIDDGSGEERKITRKYISNKNTSNNIPEINFPVLFLSQNEIINIAENNDEQIKFIDRFLDFNNYIVKIKMLESELSQLDVHFAESVDAIYNSAILEKELERLEKEIIPLNKQLKDSRYDEYIKLEQVNSAIVTQDNDANRLIKLIEDLDSILNDFNFVSIEKNVQEDAIIKRNHSYLESAFNNAKESLKKMQEIASKFQKSNWQRNKRLEWNFCNCSK